MKTRSAVLAVVVALLLLGAVAPARSGGNDPETLILQAGVASGGGYQLSGLNWQISGIASGGGYRLSEASAPSLTGSGCCCTYLPCILR